MHPGPLAPALLAAAGALLCAAHGLRHGRRPWPLGCALHVGVAVVLAPWIGLAVLAIILVASIVGPVSSGARDRVALLSVALAVPGIWLVWKFGFASEPIRPHGQLAGVLAIVSPALVPLAFALVARSSAPRDGGRQRDGAILIRLAWCAVLVPSLLVVAGAVDALDGPGVLRLASLPLGVLAAQGLCGVLRRTQQLGGAPRLGGIALAVAVAAGALHTNAHALRAHLALARTPLAVTDGGGVVAPSGEGTEDRRRAYAWLRSAHELRARRPIFVRSVAIDSGRIGNVFTPHFAALYADLGMWCDRRLEFSPGNTRWRLRHERVHELYRDRKQWDPRMMLAFERVGRPAVFLVEERDRTKTLRGGTESAFRGIDSRLLRVGCERIHVEGDVALYLWEPQGGAR